MGCTTALSAYTLDFITQVSQKSLIQQTLQHLETWRLCTAKPQQQVPPSALNQGLGI